MKLASPLDAIALPLVLRRFVQLLAALTLLCGISETFCTTVLHLHARYGFVLLDELYPDFRFFSDRFSSLHTLDFFTRYPDHPFMYPAPVAVPYAVFFLGIPHHAQSLFLLSILLSFVVAAALLARAMRARGLNIGSAASFTGCNLLLSYPIWFVYHQANMEFVVWLVLSIGIWSLFHERPYTAAICIGIAGSMKLFPFVYLGLLLARREYRAVAVSIGAAVTLTLFSLWVIYPDISVSWHFTEAAIDNFEQLYMVHLRPERGFDHSLFGLFKDLVPHLPPPPALARILSVYLLISAASGITIYFLRIRKLPVINQLLALTVASILLPPTSFDYTLIHLYAPWALLLLYTLDHYSKKGLRSASPALPPTLLCFAILFAPLTEIIVHGETIAGPIRAIVLLLLFVISLIYPFANPTLDWPSAKASPANLAASHPMAHPLST